MIEASRPNSGTAWPATWLANAIMLVPLGCFAVNVVSWLAHGVDIPFLDDWRAYQTGEAGSFDLRYLFQPVNDTLFPIGLLLDSVAQRLLGGNSIAYQLISLLLVLGSLLLLQWRLLLGVLRDRLLAACAFSATLFMLQPGSYWGLQDMAYHQAVPLVLVLFALHTVLINRWHAWLSPMLLVAAGAISGMIYISGAFAILATGIALRVASLFLRERGGSPLSSAGFWLTLVGIATAIPQAWVIVFFQKGTHHPDSPMAYPSDADFWFYLLGKIGRSLMLPAGYPGLSLTIVVVACLALTVAIVWSLSIACRSAAPNDADPGRGRAIRSAFVVLFTLSAVVGVYLAMVSAGRANLRPESMGMLDVFSFAFHRFHFFWVTLLWPWLVAILLLILRRGRATFVKPAGIAIALAVIAVSVKAGVFSHGAYYASTAELRTSGIKCIQERIEQSEPIRCDSLLPFELSASLQYAEKIDASFLRTIQFTQITMLPIDPDGQVPLVLGAADVVSGRFVSPRPGSLDAIGLFVGNYAGLADGTLSLEVCSARQCSRASRSVEESIDNDFLLIEFPQSLFTAGDESLSFSFSVAGSSHPLAVWLYPRVDGSPLIDGVLRGTAETPMPGQTVRFALHHSPRQNDSTPKTH